MLSLRILLALSIAGGVSGCSFLFVDAPAKTYAGKHYVDCTSGRAAPIADATLAGLSALLMMPAISDGEGGAVAIDAVGLLGFGAAAVRGFTATSECRRAKRDVEQRLRDDEMAELRHPRLFFPVATTPPPAPANAAPNESALAAPVVPVSPDPWLSAGPPPAFPPPPSLPPPTGDGGKQP